MQVYSVVLLPLHVIDSVLKQAARYGEQIRLLEDAGFEQDRSKVRAAWASFHEQFFQQDRYLAMLVGESYRDAYFLNIRQKRTVR